MSEVEPPPAPLPPGPPQNLAIVWDASPQDIIATWQESDDPDTPTSSLVYLLSVNSGSSTIATSGVRISAAYATTYTVSVTAKDPEGNTSNPTIVATTTPAAPPPPVEETLFELPDGKERAITMDGKAVQERLKAIAEDEDLRRYIL